MLEVSAEIGSETIFDLLVLGAGFLTAGFFSAFICFVNGLETDDFVGFETF